MTAECPTCYNSGELRVAKSDREVYDCETPNCPVDSFTLAVLGWDKRALEEPTDSEGTND